MMERALKERIIGAVVLVAIVVLVVPVFLDGPPEEGEIVSERVLLPGQDDQKTQTVVLDRDRTEPVPAASTQTNARPEAAAEEPAGETPQPVVVQPKPEPEQAPPRPAATSTTGMWAVQLGSFSNKDNAEKLAADLRKQAYAAFLSEVRTDEGVMHRVRIGPQKDRESAEAMAGRLAKVGYEGKAVPHP